MKIKNKILDFEKDNLFINKNNLNKIYNQKQLSLLCIKLIYENIRNNEDLNLVSKRIKNLNLKNKYLDNKIDMDVFNSKYLNSYFIPPIVYNDKTIEEIGPPLKLLKIIKPCISIHAIELSDKLYKSYKNESLTKKNNQLKIPKDLIASLESEYDKDILHFSNVEFDEIDDKFVLVKTKNMYDFILLFIYSMKYLNKAFIDSKRLPNTNIDIGNIVECDSDGI